MNYTNKHGIIAFTHEGNDYISDKGETIEMPDCEHVARLEKKGLIQLAVSNEQLSVKNTNKKNKLINNE